MKDEGGNLARHLQAVDQRTRIETLKAKILEIEPAMVLEGQNLTPDVEEAFLNHILTFELAPETTYFDLLEENGISLPEPATLKDLEIDELLHQIFSFLGGRNIFFLHTDHLSDRALYALMWCEIFREPTQDLSADPDTHCWIDLTSGGSDEQIQTYLAYYADDDERESWFLEWPDDPQPEKKALPFDRDRHLPGADLSW